MCAYRFPPGGQSRPDWLPASPPPMGTTPATRRTGGRALLRAAGVAVGAVAGFLAFCAFLAVLAFVLPYPG